MSRKLTIPTKKERKTRAVGEVIRMIFSYVANIYPPIKIVRAVGVVPPVWSTLPPELPPPSLSQAMTMVYVPPIAHDMSFPAASPLLRGFLSSIVMTLPAPTVKAPLPFWVTSALTEDDVAKDASL